MDKLRQIIYYKYLSKLFRAKNNLKIKKIFQLIEFFESQNIGISFVLKLRIINYKVNILCYKDF